MNLFQLRICAGYIPFFHDLADRHLLVKTSITLVKSCSCCLKSPYRYAMIFRYSHCFFVTLFLPHGPKHDTISEAVWSKSNTQKVRLNPKIGIYIGSSYIQMISPFWVGSFIPVLFPQYSHLGWQNSTTTGPPPVLACAASLSRPPVPSPGCVMGRFITTIHKCQKKVPTIYILRSYLSRKYGGLMVG